MQQASRRLLIVFGSLRLASLLAAALQRDLFRHGQAFFALAFFALPTATPAVDALRAASAGGHGGVESAVLVRGVGVFGPAPPPQGWAAESSSNGLAYLSSSFQNAECFAPRPRAGSSILACLGWQCQACHTVPAKSFGPVPSLSSRRDANGVLVCPEHEPVLRTRLNPTPPQRAPCSEEARQMKRGCWHRSPVPRHVYGRPQAQAQAQAQGLGARNPGGPGPAPAFISLLTTSASRPRNSASLPMTCRFRALQIFFRWGPAEPSCR